jgi:hypothetical protein
LPQITTQLPVPRQIVTISRADEAYDRRERELDNHHHSRGSNSK